MEENSRKRIQVCLFDFCGTFVDFQTADEYIKWATSSNSFLKRYIKKHRLVKTYNRFKIEGLYRRLFKASLSKQIIASSIKGMEVQEAKEMAESFVQSRIIPSLLPETVHFLNEYQKQGCFILLVSAAYDIYLSKMKKVLGFDDFVSTSLLNDKKTMSGKIGKDCVGKRKVKRALDYLNKKFGFNNYEIIFSIGDSKTDIPILNLAKRKVVITKNKEKWMTSDYEVIIYGNKREN